MREAGNHEQAIYPEMIEVGQFVLISRVFPEKTAWFWMGKQKPGPVTTYQKRLTYANVMDLRRLLQSHPEQWVYAHVPIKTTRVRSRNLMRMLHGDFGWLAYREVLQAKACRLVGMDFNDKMQLSPVALQILDRSICFFKRELAMDFSKLLPPNATRQQRQTLDRNAHKLMPISLGLCADRQCKLPPVAATKTSDLFFAGGLTSEIRKREIGLLDQLRAFNVRVDQPAERLCQADFFQRCSQSHLVWSPEGFGWDCFRHYEAAATGSVPVMNEPTIVSHQPLLHQQHAFYYRPEAPSKNRVLAPLASGRAGLVETVLQALQDRDRLVEMGKAGREFVLQHHTHQRIVEHIVNASAAFHENLRKNSPIAFTRTRAA